MVISAVSRAGAKIVARAKTKKYFATQKVKRVKRAVIKRGKDAVKVQKTSVVRKEQGDRGIPDPRVIKRRHIITSRTQISPFLISKSEEVQGDPKVFHSPFVSLSNTPEAIDDRTIAAPIIRETIVSVKPSPKKLIAYKKKEQGETGYIHSSGTGGIDLSFYPYRPTETAFGIGVGNKPLSKSKWGIVHPKRSVEVFKKTRMEDDDASTYGEQWIASHVTGIRVTSPKPNFLKKYGLSTSKGVGFQKTEQGTALTGEIDSTLYTFGTITKSGGRVSERPFFTAVMDVYDDGKYKRQEWLSFGFGAKYKVPKSTHDIHITAGTRGVRIPNRDTRKRIKRATLPAFAATSTGFIIYSGTEKKAKKKKRRGKK